MKENNKKKKLDNTDNIISEENESSMKDNHANQTIEKKKNKRHFGRIIFNTIITILFLVIIVEAGIGVINMQRISEDEEPIWYFSTDKIETDSKTVTKYNLGLYRIIKTDTKEKSKITLKPFFLSD